MLCWNIFLWNSLVVFVLVTLLRIDIVSAQNQATAIGTQFGSANTVFGPIDINNDTFSDFGFTDQPSNSIVFVLGNSSSSFLFTTQNFTFTNDTDFPLQGFICADFNGDSRLDLAASSTSTVYVFYGTPGGFFESNSTWQYSDGGMIGYSLASGDLNGDQIDDLVIGSPNNSSAGHVYSFHGGASGLNNYFSMDSSALNFGKGLTVADYDSDNYADVVVAVPEASTILYFRSNGNGVSTTFYPYGELGASLGSAMNSVDLNNDGYPDLIVTARDDGYVHYFAGGPSGLPVAPNVTLSLPAPYGDKIIAVGDINFDGYQDIIITNQSARSWNLYLGSSVGLSQAALNRSEVNTTTDPWAIGGCGAGDLNDDGVLDFVVSGKSELLVYTNFVPPTPSPSSSAIPVAPSPSSSGRDGNSGAKKTLGQLIGAVVGSLLGACVVVAIVVFLLIRRRRQKDESTKEDQGPTVVAMTTVSTQPITDRRFEIDFNDLQIGKEIGKGAFGVVYKAKWRNVDCVVKQLNINSKDESAMSTFLKEANTVKNLKNHPNVCTINGVCTRPENPICIVMEWVPGGSLLNLIFTGKIKPDTLTVIRLAKDICIGMNHIHQENILHCDLACRNLLVDNSSDKLIVKVTDFGLARHTESGIYTPSSQAVFPIRWSAPEVLTRHQVSRASDVWSFGVTLWEIMEGANPYPGLTNNEVVDYVREGKILPRPKGEQYPIQIYEIMKQCWNLDPSVRPSFNDLVIIFSDLEEKYKPQNLKEDLSTNETNNNHNESDQYQSGLYNN